MRLRTRARWAGTSFVLVALAAVVATTLTAPPAAAYQGAPWFQPGRTYDANFPDPSVLAYDGRYYAYGTTTGGSYIPVMHSSDLVTWTAREAYAPGNKNDALLAPASWGETTGSGYFSKDVDAPGVARIGGRFVLYYAIVVANGGQASVDGRRRCISVATADSPLGPFVDNSTGPLVCDADPGGSIDPQPFVDTDTGAAYLIWKSEGVPGSAPTKIWSRRLDASGTGFAGGTTASLLLATSQGWEGDVIENPSMVRYRGQLLLFYSGNDWQSAAYATGLATCSSPTGGCAKASRNPILASRNDRLGPGGATAFLDHGGQLQLAYHWWNAPYTSYPAYPACQSAGTCQTQGQRRLAVEPVYLTVAGAQVGGTPPPFGGDRAVSVAASASGGGYVIAGAEGRLASYGDAPSAGSMAGSLLNAPIVATDLTVSGGGYWLLGSDGGVFSFGDASFYGSTGSMRLNRPVVSLAATTSGGGYWFVAADGGIFAFGDAAFYGSTGSMVLNQPVVGMAATPSGRGYWLVASDGGIFAFGDAAFYGSTGSTRLNQPIVGMAATPSGRGYWLVASDGGIFAFGDAAFYGSTGSIVLNQPVVGMAATPSGGGYWLAAADGGIFAYGNATFHGSR